MRKVFFIFFFLSYIVASGFSAEGHTIRTTGLYTNYERFLRFTEQGRIISYTRVPDAQEALTFTVDEGNYTITLEYGVPYLTVKWDKYWGTENKYLYLFYGEGEALYQTILLYDGNAEPFFIGTHVNGILETIFSDWGYGGDHRFTPGEFTATSSLQDGTGVFSTNNLNLSIGKPWAEGVAGYGIGEKLTLCAGAFPLSQSNLYISIGFVSYSEPQLYEYNSRPAKIRLSHGDDSIIVDLLDTPHFQFIDLPYWHDGNLEIEILDVYPGTKWQDTCINSILFSWSQ